MGADAATGAEELGADAEAEFKDDASRVGAGWRVTALAGGKDGSLAGDAGMLATAAPPAGTTTAVAGGESGVCRVHADRPPTARANRVMANRDFM